MYKTQEKLDGTTVLCYNSSGKRETDNGRDIIMQVKMTKYFLCLLCIFMLLALCGCGSADETEYNGTSEDFDENSLTIMTEDGEELTFDISSAELQCLYDLEEDNYLSVFCKGRDKDIAVRVIDYPAGDGTALKGEEGSVDTSSSSASVTTATINGKIIEITADMMKVQNDADNTVYTFTTALASQKYSKGAAYGTRVTVEYSGVLNAGDTTGVNVCSVCTEGLTATDDSNNTADTTTNTQTNTAAQNNTADETKSFYGSVVDFNGNYMTITEAVTDNTAATDTAQNTTTSANTAETISLYTKDAELNFPNGIQAGTPVTVIYKPSAAKISTNGAVSVALLKNATIISIEGTGESCNVSVTGTVDKSSVTGKLFLNVSDGALLQFNTKDAVNDSVNALKEGSTVKVVFANGQYANGKVPKALQILDVK